jgi:hypothetical protein
MAITVSGTVTMGEAISFSERITEQFAVPPRISGPYDGIQDTCLPACIPVSASTFPRNRIPWPPKPARIILSTFDDIYAS